MHESVHHSFEVEQEQPSNRTLTFYGLGILVVFFGCGILITSLFHRVAIPLVEQRSTRPPPELRELRAREEQLLGSYGWVDREKQIVRIPIERAMQLIVEGDRK